MSPDGKAPARRDRARAFVAELIPEPEDLEPTGPLNAKEQQQLERIHSARDHHQAAKWMRGKALDSAFRRRLFRGEDGQRTRQQYLDAEWDGMSESAAYLEIREWPLAAQISATFGRPAPDSHVRALVGVAENQGHETVAAWYADLRRHGQELGQRVTADVVANLADFLLSETEPERLEAATLFVPRQLSAAKPRKAAASSKQAKRGTNRPVTGTLLPPAFQNFRTGVTSAPAGKVESGWTLSADHVARLSTWLADGAAAAGIDPERAADLLVQALTEGTFPPWVEAQA
ncbi:hypothetical protein ACFY7N_31020 [Streptomyces albidoflavus]|uniref:hypothetical protein n=1 Tax=Streptomyces TaxID=1883 RepID=UPI0005606ADD|nr:hypothetical protein [Streptomyces sp. NRRL F-6628]